MSYEHHLERDGRVPLDEWKHAVASVPSIRLDHRPATATNPATGMRASIESCAADAAVLLEGQWTKVFRCFEGRVAFKAVDLDNAESPVASAAWPPAQVLSARLVGDEASGIPSGER